MATIASIRSTFTSHLSVAERLEYYSMPEPISGCTLCRLAPNEKGYATISFNGKHSLAHRVAWELKNGPIEKRLNVLHTCDTPACINTDHLFLGTQADNMRDKVKKGRGRASYGEKHVNAKLT